MDAFGLATFEKPKKQRVTKEDELIVVASFAVTAFKSASSQKRSKQKKQRN
jgi:hypothetical protein